MKNQPDSVNIAKLLQTNILLHITRDSITVTFCSIACMPIQCLGSPACFPWWWFIRNDDSLSSTILLKYKKCPNKIYTLRCKWSGLKDVAEMLKMLICWEYILNVAIVLKLNVEVSINLFGLVKLIRRK